MKEGLALISREGVPKAGSLTTVLGLAAGAKQTNPYSSRGPRAATRALAPAGYLLNKQSLTGVPAGAGQAQQSLPWCDPGAVTSPDRERRSPEKTSTSPHPHVIAETLELRDSPWGAIAYTPRSLGRKNPSERTHTWHFLLTGPLCCQPGGSRLHFCKLNDYLTLLINQANRSPFGLL